MCPLCIGSALLVLTGAGSAGGLAAVIACAAKRRTRPQAQDSGELTRSADRVTPREEASTRDRNL